MLAVFIHLGIGAMLFFCFWIWTLLDVISTDEMLCRNLNKGLWVTLVLCMPLVGSMVWLLAGRPVGASLTVGGNNSYETNPHRSTARGFEDSADWSRSQIPAVALNPQPDMEISESSAVKERRLLEWEAELAKREQALSEGAEPDDA